MAKIFQFSSKATNMTYNFTAPLKPVVVTKGVAIVEDEATAEALNSVLEQTSLGMYSVQDYDPAVHNVTAKVHSVTDGRADPLVHGILQSGVAVQNPVLKEVDDALAMALTQGQEAVNALVAENPEVLGDLTPVQESAPATPIKLGKK